MGRIVVAIGFIVLFVLSIAVYYTRTTGSLRDNLEDEEAVPQIELRNFTLKIFDDGVIKSEISAKQSQFMDPNKVEIFNNVRGYRLVENEYETISCQLATAFFEGRSLGEVLEDTKLSRAELDGDVRIRMDENLLITDSTSYDMISKLLYSDLPVTVVGLENKFSGENGFSYDTVNQVLKMEGMVTGELQVKGDSP